MYIKSNDEFIEELGKLYDATALKSCVRVTFKRYVPRPEKKKKDEKEKKDKKRTLPEGCLYVRAKTDKKKICTGVLHKDLVKFQVGYSVLCKGKMTGLKKHHMVVVESVQKKLEKKPEKKQVKIKK